VTDELDPPSGGRVVVAGDWHGNTAWARRVVEQTAAIGVDTILQVGDLGVLWPGDVANAFAFKLQRELDRHGVRLVFVDGNHDNHTALRALPRDTAGFGVITAKTKGGGRLNLIRWAPRGHRWTWPGSNGRQIRFGALGGAFSIDHRYRRAGRDWWPGIEEVEPQDLDTLGPEPLDVLVAHDCPAGAEPPSTMPIASDDAEVSKVSRYLLRAAVDATLPRLVFAGHWHQRSVCELEHDGAHPTVVHVMGMDGQRGNWAVLNLETLQVS
jgi:Icc-related predicted phosphoesterase